MKNKNRRSNKIEEFNNFNMPKDQIIIKDKSPLIPQRSKIKTELHISERSDLTTKQKEFISLVLDKKTNIKRVAKLNTIPTEATNRGSTLSESRPAIGAKIIWTHGAAIKIKPAVCGENPLIYCK